MRLKSSLDRWALFFLLLACAYECFEYARWNNRTFYMDKDRQIMAAQSMLAGRGLTELFADSSDLSKDDNRPLVGWTPGYSWMVAPVLAATGDVILSGVVIEIAAVLLFFGSAWLLLGELPELISPGFRAGVFAWWAFVGSPLSKTNVTDALAVSFVVLGLWSGTRMARGEQDSGRLAAFSGFCFAAAAAMRFAYWPLAGVGAFASAGLWLLGERRLLRPILIQAGTTAALMAALAAHYYMLTGRITRLDWKYPAEVRGYYWGQLKQVIPFPAGVWGLFEPFRSSVTALGLPAAVETAGLIALWVVSIALLVIAFLGLLQAWRTTAAARFALLGVTASAALTGAMLLSLTVRMPGYAAELDETPEAQRVAILTQMTASLPEHGDPEFYGHWVHGRELRYWAPTFMIFLLSLGAWTRSKWAAWPKGRRRIVICVLVLTALPPTVIRTRRIVVALDPHQINVYQQRWESDWRIIGQALDSLGGQRVVYLDPNVQRRRFGGLHGAVMADPRAVGENWPTKRHGATVLFAAQPDAAPPGAQTIGRLSDLELWLLAD